MQFPAISHAGRFDLRGFVATSLHLLDNVASPSLELAF
jgi:hypothetical protein